MSFHQYSWNSEVETTWISFIGWHHKISTIYLLYLCNEGDFCTFVNIKSTHLSTIKESTFWMHWRLQQNWAQNYCFAVTCNKTSPFIGCSQNLRASKACNWNSCWYLFIFHISNVLKIDEENKCTSEKCVRIQVF